MQEGTTELQLSTTNCNNMFDSKFCKIPMDVKMQIAGFIVLHQLMDLNKSSYKVRLDHRTVGVFATDLAFGLNPASHQYKQDQLQPHFIECLKSKQMTPCPSINIQPGKSKTKVLVYILSLHDGKEQMMAQCTGCKQWYHKSCEKIPQAVLVGTFRCAGQVVHYWSAHSFVRDMLSIIGRHIHLCGTCCPLLVGTFSGARLGLALIGGCLGAIPLHGKP